MCSERDSPIKRLYRRTHAKLTRLAGSGQLVWAAGCELSLALVHARRPAWPGETSETVLRVAPPCKTRPLDHTRVNWPVDASASGSAQVGQVGATDEPREFRLARSRQDKRLERAIPLTTHLCLNINQAASLNEASTYLGVQYLTKWSSGILECSLVIPDMVKVVPWCPFKMAWPWCSPWVSWRQWVLGQRSRLLLCYMVDHLWCGRIRKPSLIIYQPLKINSDSCQP